MANSQEEINKKIMQCDYYMENKIIHFLLASSRLIRFATEASLQNVRKQSENLAENAIDINKVLDQIDEISLETRMLSLHAHVEAAHAGESGKGFAVVAGEIGSLAQSSKETVQAIGKANGGINSGIQKTREHLAELLNSMKFIPEKEDAIIEIMGNDAPANKLEIEKSVLHDIGDALMTHVDFINSFIANVNNDAFTIVNHERCQFGLWYEDHVMQFGEIPEFSAVYDIHKKFHDLAILYKKNKSTKTILEISSVPYDFLVSILQLAAKFIEMAMSGALQL
ncbi:MAG: methyl-accepting chemotaxis protein [Clostridiales bacterium]|jgi:hypothetical protein|nr:methyl-accepting chemotaxis protein [Clostridiales bacterium]